MITKISNQTINEDAMFEIATPQPNRVERFTVRQLDIQIDMTKQQLASLTGRLKVLENKKAEALLIKE